MRNISKSGSPVEGEVTRVEELFLSLGRMRRGLRDPLSASCEHLDLTPPQLHALMWLGWDGALTMGELARRGGVTEKTITGVVDRMEGAGLLRRVRDEKDRRIVRTELTEAGKKAFAGMREQMRSRLGQLLQLLDRDDRRSLLGLLEKLRDRIVESRADAREGHEESA